MKVLMFGWEFPPHISGGLGTACYGLTHALLKSGTRIRFVVPTLPEGDYRRQRFLVNASAVPFTEGQAGINALPEGRLPSRTKKHTSTFTVVERHNMTIMEVPAAIRPYRDTGERVAMLRTESQAEHVSERDRSSSTPRSQEPSLEDDDALFMFTGTYGDDLMTEVDRYAEVAGIIAGKYAFDIIHVHDWMTFPAGIAAKEKSGKPLVVHVHSTEFDRAGSHINEHVSRIEKAGLSKADRIIAVSRWTRKILVDKYLVPEGKISVVHNGVLPREQPAPYSFPDIASHFVTFLGRITHQKGPWFFVEAARKVLGEFPEAHFIVAGAGDLLPQTIERVAQLNMSASFHFTGFLSPEQVDQLWSLTDVYVMPSVSEPFGIAPLEAIQGGVPVILSKQSGVSEVMPHAIKVDFWDVDALAGAICSVLRYESLSRVLQRNSKKHIHHLTWDKAAADVKAVYHDLIGEKGT